MGASLHTPKAPGFYRARGWGCLSSPDSGWQVEKSPSSFDPVTSWLCGLGQGPRCPVVPGLNIPLKLLTTNKKGPDVAVRNADPDGVREAGFNPTPRL